MSESEPVTIHAARIDRDGTWWFQVRADGGWGATPRAAYTFPHLSDLDEAYGPTRLVRIATGDPGDAWEIERLRVKLADEKAAHATTRENFAEHVGAEFYPPPTDVDKMTGAPWTIVRGEDGQAYARYEDPPAGLSVDQHIRALALDAAVRTLADGEEGGDFSSSSSEITVRWVLATAGRYAALIRDGQVPDA